MALSRAHQMAMGCIYLVLSVALLMVGSAAAAGSSKFEELFQPSWAMDHFAYEGDMLKMKLDNFSGTFFFYLLFLKLIPLLSILLLVFICIYIYIYIKNYVHRSALLYS